MPRLISLALPLLVLSACSPGTDPAPQNADQSDDARPFSEIADDAVVQFTGTEPFWGGKVAGARLTYSTPDDIDGTSIAVERFAGRGGVSWSGTYRGAPFTLAITPGTCSDGMSDRAYPYTATLSVSGEQREGCGWTAARPFTQTADSGGETGAQPAELAAQQLVMAQWRKAANRASCAPVSFVSTGAAGQPRAATFAGGWAVAFDQPGLRSAFGVAGTGVVPEGDAGTEAQAHAQRARLTAQWPLVRDLAALPGPAFAGYGIEGAGAYPPGNPDGKGLNSLAYVRIAGQSCDYNVWSRLGRAHLESLLENLRLVAT